MGEPDAEPQRLRGAFGRFATGVTVITCRAPSGDPHGATVTAFTPISLAPPLVQVALTRKSKACDYLDGAPFAVNVLAAEQRDLAMHFAGRPGADPIPWVSDPTSPTLAEAAATFFCRPWRVDEGGDHRLFLGEIVAVRTTERNPLLFHDSAFHKIGARSSETIWFGCQDDPHLGWFDESVTFTPAHAAHAPQNENRQ